MNVRIQDRYVKQAFFCFQFVYEEVCSDFQKRKLRKFPRTRRLTEKYFRKFERLKKFRKLQKLRKFPKIQIMKICKFRKLPNFSK
jgi:hypothetical protein